MRRPGRGDFRENRDDLGRRQERDAVLGQCSDRTVAVAMPHTLRIGTDAGSRRAFRVASRHFDAERSRGLARDGCMIGFDQLAVLANRVARGNLVHDREQRADGKHRHRERGKPRDPAAAMPGRRNRLGGERPSSHGRSIRCLFGKRDDVKRVRPTSVPRRHRRARTPRALP